MEVYFHKDKIEIEINIVDAQDYSYRAVEEYLGARIPYLWDGVIGKLTYPSSLRCLITIPKKGKPSWKFKWTYNEDDQVTIDEKWLRGEFPIR